MARSVVRIERKQADAPEAAERLRRALSAANRLDVTPAEAAAVSGLPIAMCEDALWHLAAELAPRIRVSEAGALRFTFETLAPARPDLRRRLEAWGRRHAMGLKLAALLIVMPPYFLTVAAHTASLTQLPDSYGLVGLALKAVAAIATVPVFILGIGTFFQFHLMPVGGLTLLGISLGVLLPSWLRSPDDTFSAILMPLTLIMGVAWSVGAYMFYKHWVFGRRNLFGLKLWRAVSGLLFGGDLVLDDSLSDEKRLTALVARRDGVLTTADLVATFGWTPEEADGQLARILLDYGGEVVVTEEGAIAYRFPSLVGADAPESIDTRPFYERDAAPPDFFQAPVGFVRGFLAITVIGLLGLLLRPHPAFWPNWNAEGQGGLSDQVMSQGAGGVPYALIAAVLLVRYGLHRRACARHAADAPKRHIARLATLHPEGRFMKRVPAKLLAAFGGTLHVERTRPDGAVWVHFPAFALSAIAAETLRAEQRAAIVTEPGVAFDTAG
ncbi:MAG: hypothetical protein ACK46X_15825 [Candidatus Sericytochromatia bacterium]